MVSRFIKGLIKKGDEHDDCVHSRELFSEYVDDGLDDSTAKRLSAHLEGCGPCQAFLRTFRATLNLLRSSRDGDTPAAPEGFRDRVMSEIREREADSPS